MRVWKCKQVIDFDQSTTTVKEERNKTLQQKMTDKYNRFQVVTCLWLLPFTWLESFFLQLYETFPWNSMAIKSSNQIASEIFILFWRENIPVATIQEIECFTWLDLFANQNKVSLCQIAQGAKFA